MAALRLPLLFLLALLSTACGIYRQNVVNVPLLQRKGQLHLGGHGSFSGPEVQASYAVTNFLGVLGNYNNMGERSENSSYVRRHYFGEAGIGVYKKQTDSTSHFAREVFLLAGQGMTSRRSSFSFEKAFYDRYCVQADLGWVTEKTSISISPRLFRIEYHHITDTGRSDYQQLRGKYVYAEGAFTLRYNAARYLTLSGQAIMTLPITDQGERKYNYYYDFAPFNVSAGLILNLDLLRK